MVRGVVPYAAREIGGNTTIPRVPDQPAPSRPSEPALALVLYCTVTVLESETYIPSPIAATVDAILMALMEKSW